MKNTSLVKVLTLSLLAIPGISSADGIVSLAKLEMGGQLTVQNKKEINLEVQGGESIKLTKGHATVEISKLAAFFSFSEPTLTIKQKGQTFVINIPKDSYHNKEAFTLKSEDSNLNYDLYLRKHVARGRFFEKEDSQVCNYHIMENHCETENGSTSCNMKSVMKIGIQDGISKHQLLGVTYKLTLAQKNAGLAEFSSTVEDSEKIQFKATEACHSPLGFEH